MASPQQTPSSYSPKGGLGKSLLRSGLSYGAGHLINRVIAFLLVPLYTRRLTPEDYGVVSLAETLAAVVAVFATLSLPAAVVRMLHRYDERPAERTRFISTMLVGAIVTVFVTGSLCIAAAPFLKTSGLFDIPFMPVIPLAIGGTLLTQLAQIPLSVLQAQQRATTYSVLSVGAALVTTLSVVALVILFDGGAVGMLVGKLLGALFIFGAGVWVLRAEVRAKPSWPMYREAARFALPLVPHSLSAWLLAGSDRLVIGAVLSSHDVGLYALMAALAAVMATFTSAIILSWAPSFYRLADGPPEDHRRAGSTAVQIAGLMTVIALLGMGVGQPFVLIAIDERFHAGAQLIPLLILGQLLHGYFSVFHLGILVRGRTGLLVFMTAGTALVNLTLGLLLVPRLGGAGAGVAMLVAEGLQAFVCYRVAQSLCPLPLEPRRLVLLTLLAALPVIASVLPFSRQVLITAAVSLLAIGGVGGVVGLSSVRRGLEIVQEILRRRASGLRA